MTTKANTRKNLLCLVEGALLVALAQILSYLQLWELPQGGSVTIGMLPIFLYCVRWGFGPGMLASFAAMVRGEKENPYTYDYELELYKTVLQCCGVEVK